jgi:hypothetical protein
MYSVQNWLKIFTLQLRSLLLLTAINVRWYFRICFVPVVFSFLNTVSARSVGKDIDENLIWKFPVHYQFLIILCSYMKCLLSNPCFVLHSFSHIGDQKTQLSIFSVVGVYCWRIYNLKSWSSVHLINQCKLHKFPCMLSLVHLQLSLICISDQHTVYYKMKVLELTQMQWLHNNYSTVSTKAYMGWQIPSSGNHRTLTCGWHI